MSRDIIFGLISFHANTGDYRPIKKDGQAYREEKGSNKAIKESEKAEGNDIKFG